MKKWLFAVLRVVLALVFIYSGFVKCVDPMGTLIKLDEYLLSFKLDFFSFLSPILSVLLPAAELFLGVALLFGIYKRVVSLLVLIFMCFFTVLTLWIYIFDPVSDCGCFGDALILTNGQTFFKNLILLGMSVAVFRITRLKEARWRYEKFYAWLFGLFCISIPVYAYVYLPAIEFLPYKVGVDINDLVSFKADKQEPLMLYRNKITNETKEFKLSDQEWQDTVKWEFVELLDNSKQKKIVSFDVLDKRGDNISNELLQEGDTTLFLVAKDVENLRKYDDKLLQIVDLTHSLGYRAVVLTTSNIENSEHDFSEEGLAVEVCNMDETMIKSFVRSDVGVVIVGDGRVLSKNNLKYMSKVQNRGFFDEQYDCQSSKKMRFILIYSLAFVLLGLSLVYYRKKEY